MNRNAKISIFGFCLGLCGCLFRCGIELFEVVRFGQNEVEAVYESVAIVILFGIFILLVFLVLAKSRSMSIDKKLSPKRNDEQEGDEDDLIGVIARSSFLGWIFSIGIILIHYNKWWESPFGLYLCTLSSFHYSEYVATAITSPSTLSTDSFLLNHSRAYAIAAVASWAEFGLELYFLPGIKRLQWVVVPGLILCICGEILRKLAMLTAMENFTHIIRSEKVEGHKLVTHGVFRLCRHPSYAGWFWWSIGTQVLLVNPICIIGYALASWNFFCYRITYEEATLYSFFGDEYKKYQERVPRSGIPLITGYMRKRRHMSQD